MYLTYQVKIFTWFIFYILIKSFLLFYFDFYYSLPFTIKFLIVDNSSLNKFLFIFILNNYKFEILKNNIFC